jgi:hypothetical protein
MGLACEDGCEDVEDVDCEVWSPALRVNLDLGKSNPILSAVEAIFVGGTDGAWCKGPYNQVTSLSLSQLRFSGEMVLSLFRCFHHVLQEAFSRRMPFAISYFALVIERHDRQTSSSAHW